MKLTNNLTFISLLALTFAQDSIGTITMNSVDKSIIGRGVLVIGDALHGGDRYSAFTTDDEDIIITFSSNMTVGVDDGKKLNLGKYPTMLSLAKEVSEDRWLLQANGSTIFQLCGDGSIRLNSDCQGGKKVILYFESLV